MDKNWQKQIRRIQLKQNILSGLAVFIPCIAGTLMGLVPNNSPLALYVLVFASILLGPRLETLLHEFGHLVFGKLSGYRFGYFGIGNHLWMKKDRRLIRRSHTMHGAAGYCAMCVPEMSEPPVRLFYLGGVLMDTISALVFFTTFLISRGRIPYLPFFCLMQATLALFFALNNAIPQKLVIHNDGYRLRALLQCPESLKAMVRHSRISETLHINNIRLRDMPEEWFPMPEETAWQNCTLASSAINCTDRMIDSEKFAEAQAEIRRILSSDADISPMDRILLTANLTSIGLLLGEPAEKIHELADSFMQRHMKSMTKSPVMQRSYYILSLLLYNDGRAEAEKARECFERLAAESAWPADFEIDRKMMDMAMEIYDGKYGTPKPEPKIRRATMDDLNSITAIYSEIHDEIAAGRASIGWIRGVYPTRETAEASIQKGDMFVLEDGGSIVAAARINQYQGPEYDDAVWSFEADPEDVMVLHTLVVSPKSKGRGYGTKFVAFYEDYARQHGCTALRMDTNAINAAARALYKKLGYAEACVVPCNFNGIPGVNLVCLDKRA